MNSKTLVMTLAASSVLFAGGAMAGEIYKYIDDDGNVSYVDRPTMDPDRVQMDISSRPTDNAAVQANTQARLQAANAKSAARAKEPVAQEGEELTRAERRAEAAARQQQCENDLVQLATIEGRSRLYKQDENGEPVYLSDEESQAARDGLRAHIQRNCG